MYTWTVTVSCVKYKTVSCQLSSWQEVTESHSGTYRRGLGVVVVVVGGVGGPAGLVVRVAGGGARGRRAGPAARARAQLPGARLDECPVDILL